MSLLCLLNKWALNKRKNTTSRRKETVKDPFSIIQYPNRTIMKNAWSSKIWSQHITSILKKKQFAGSDFSCVPLHRNYQLQSKEIFLTLVTFSSNVRKKSKSKLRLDPLSLIKSCNYDGDKKSQLILKHFPRLKWRRKPTSIERVMCKSSVILLTMLGIS